MPRSIVVTVSNIDGKGKGHRCFFRVYEDTGKAFTAIGNLMNLYKENNACIALTIAGRLELLYRSDYSTTDDGREWIRVTDPKAIDQIGDY